jgi:serine phosphatase RsbU (regulator of sigma subunit)
MAGDAEVTLKVTEIFENRFSNPQKGVRDGLLLENKVRNKHPELLPRLWKGIGWCFYYLSDYPNSFRYANKALDFLSEKVGSDEYTDHVVLLGWTYLRIGDFKNALEITSPYQRKIKGNERNLALIYALLASIYSGIEDNKNARFYCEKSCKIFEKTGPEINLGSQLINLSGILRAENKFRESLKVLKKAEPTLRKLGGNILLGTFLNNLGSTYYELGEYKKSELAYQESIKNFKKAKNSFGATNSEIHLCKTLIKQKKYAKAKSNLDRCFKISRKNKNETHLCKIHELKAELYSAKGNFKLAFEAMNQFRISEKKVLNDKSVTEIKNRETFISLTTSEKEKDTLKQINRELSVLNKEIKDSLNYAAIIQGGMLPKEEKIKALFPKSTLLFKPKDIVSGDFLWIKNAGDVLMAAVGDCTGHGVPGGLLSVLGISHLNTITGEKKISDPGTVLNELRAGISDTLNPEIDQQERKDGMDFSFISFNPENFKLKYSLANQTLYHLPNGEITEYKGENQALAHQAHPIPFTTREISLSPGDLIVLSTDGFPDQFGGPEGKKLKYPRFRNILVELKKKNLSDRKKFLEKKLRDWKGDLEQTDDILILAIEF